MNWRKTTEHGLRLFFKTNAFLSAIVLLGILAFLLAYAVRAFLPRTTTPPSAHSSEIADDIDSLDEEQADRPVTLIEFLFGREWNPDAYTTPKYGILPLLLGSIFTTLIALVIAVPVGIASAIFISEQLKGLLRVGVKTMVELFAGFPSVVLGFFGLVVLSPLLARLFHASSGLNVLNAGLILGLMALPTIISVTDDALRVVPHSFREAAYALGATPLTTALRVVVPAARSGILAASMLGFGRAIGETMAVLMVAGNAPLIPRSLFDPVRTITSTIAIELGESVFNTTHFFVLFALGLVLFLIALATNLVAESLVRREKRSFTL